MPDKEGLLSIQELEPVYDKVMTDFVPEWYFAQHKKELLEIYYLIIDFCEDDVELTESESTNENHSPKPNLTVINGGLN